MKIGIFDPYLDTLGGGEKYMLTLAECLSKTHDVSLFWDNPEDIKKNILRFGLDFTNVKTTKNIFSPSISTTKRFLLSRKYDAIFFLSDGSIPMVMHKLYVHFQFPVEWLSPGSISKVKMRRVSTVFCNSRFTAVYIDKKLHIKSQVLYPPVDIAKAKPETEKKNVILHVGRFSGTSVEGDDYKKQQKMIAMFKKMVDQGLADWEFVVASSVREQEEEKFLAMQHMAHGYPISFVKNSSNAKLWEYYNSASIYWHASGLGEDLVSHPERAEHFGISTVEAMSAGCVPVVIKAGGQPEIVTDGVNGLLWENEEDCLRKTSRLIADNKLRHRLSKEAVVRARAFTKEHFCEQVQKMIV